MKNIKRKMVVLMMALAMTVMSAMSAFAATYKVEMYGIGSDGTCQYSEHTEGMVKSVTKRGSRYTVVFQPTTVQMGATAVEGYISALTANGTAGTLDDTTNELSITFTPAPVDFTGVKDGETVTASGTPITYSIATGSFTHPNSSGYLVIVEE